MVKGSVASVAGALTGFVCLAFAGSADAYRFEIGDFDLSLNSEFTVGGIMRIEERDPNLVSKLSNNPFLCPEDCLNLGGANGDPAPNQKLVNARGGFIASQGDDGNLRFEKYDVVSAQMRINNDLTVRWGDVIFQFTGLGFYDPVHSDLLGDTTTQFFHPDNFQDVPPAQDQSTLGVGPIETANQRRFTELSDADISQIGHDYDILEAFVATPFSLFGQQFNISVGEQRIRWGEALFNVLGSLDQLNPVDQNRLFFPATEIASVFEPTGLVVLSTQFTSNVGIEAVYQYDWEPSQPAATASLFNFVEGAGGRESITLSLGQLSEDPDRRGGFTNDTARAATSTTLGLPLGQTRGHPESGGQYGMRLNWYLPDFNGGTELSFYAANYHSRLPSFNAFASDQSCTRNAADAPAPGTGIVPALDVLEAQLDAAVANLPPPGNNASLNNLDAQGAAVAIACGGFNGQGTTAQALQATFGPLSPNGPSEPLPAGTVRPFLVYPEDIHMFGLSFTTKLGKWSLAGEYAYRPNQPFAIQPTDVFFAALQPSLPDEDVNILVGTLPGNRAAVPDVVETQFRGNKVEANELVKGFERFKVHTTDFTGIRVFGSSNIIGASQIILAVEAGATYLPNITDPQELPLATLDLAGATHPSPGADGTGRPGGEPDPRSLNPTQQTENYPDDFSAGYRILFQPRYNNLIFGKTVLPTIAFLHDVVGIAPFPLQNYVEGRKQIIWSNELQITPAFNVTFDYQAFFGGAFDNLGDRDNIKLSASYAF